MSPSAPARHAPATALTAGVTVLVLAALAFAPGVSLAGGPLDARPLDAPRVDPTARVPPAPPEYLLEDGGWIRFSYHPAARERVRTLTALADGMREELQAELGRGVLDASAPVEVRVAAMPSELARLAPPDVRWPADALSFSERRLVVMSIASGLGSDPPDLEVVLRHALAHVALDDALGGRPVPRWFHEGHATRFARDGRFGRARTLCSAALRRRLVPPAGLGAALPPDPLLAEGSIAHAEAADFVRFVAEGQGASRGRLGALAARVRAGDDFDHAVGAAFAADLDQVARAWREDMARRYALFPVLLLAGLVVAAAAAVVAWRRWRRAGARVVRSARHAPLRPEVEVRIRSARGLSRGARLARAAEQDDDVERFQGPLPPDPEVPKVEHEGRWHTLH
jgi:hypothetical protein